MESKDRMFAMLQDVITHFSSNPLELRSKWEDTCLYNPPINKPLSIGCGIGMYLSVKTAKLLDDEGGY